MKKKILPLLVIMLLISAVLGGCRAGYEQSQESVTYKTNYQTSAADTIESASYQYDYSEENGVSYDSNEVGITQQVIKHASLTLTIEDMEEAVTAMQNLVAETEGFVQSSSVWETNGKKRGSFILRVPSTQFMSVLTRIQSIGLVDRLDQSTQDVTEEYIDLTARLKTLEAKQDTYISLLEKAETVEDILKIEEELDRVLYEIERNKGQLQYLERNVSMSTINVSLSEMQPQQTKIENFGSQLKYALRDGYGNMTQMIVFLISKLVWLIPFIPFVAVVFLALYWLIKKIKKAKLSKKQPPHDQI